MALLTAGYWHTTYWVNNYWNDAYWQDYAAPVITGAQGMIVDEI